MVNHGIESGFAQAHIDARIVLLAERRVRIAYVVKHFAAMAQYAMRFFIKIRRIKFARERKPWRIVYDGVEARIFELENFIVNAGQIGFNDRIFEKILRPGIIRSGF